MRIFVRKLPALFVFVLLSLSFCRDVTAQVISDQYGNDYIVIDPKAIRGTIGFSTLNLSMDTLDERKAWGINTRDEVRLISSFMDEDNHLAIRDAFFCDLTLGALTSDPLSYFGRPEGKFSGAFAFGYDVVIGYRNENFGLFAGRAFRWDVGFIGSSWIPGDQLLHGNYPFLFRGEYHLSKKKGDEFRVVVNAWSRFNADKKSYGGNIDIPFTNKRRIWLTAEYKVFGADASPASYDNYQYADATLTQFTVGFKIGSIY